MFGKIGRLIIPKREPREEELSPREQAMLRREEYRMRIRRGGTSPRVMRRIERDNIREKGLREKGLKEK